MKRAEYLTYLNMAGHAPRLVVDMRAVPSPLSDFAGRLITPGSKAPGLTDGYRLTWDYDKQGVIGGRPSLPMPVMSAGTTGQILTSGGEGEAPFFSAVSPPQVSFAPRNDSFTGTGSTTSFALTTRITESSWRDAIVVARNGQMLLQVSKGFESDVSEFSCGDDGSITSIKFGDSPLSGDVISVIYWA